MKAVRSSMLLLFLVAAAQFRVLYSQESDEDPTAERPPTALQEESIETAYFPSRCDVLLHKLLFEEDGCRGEAPALSCVGTCESGEDPLFTFGSRDDVPNYPFKSRCRCCQAVGGIVTKQVDIHWVCADNTTKTTKRLASTATGCTCAPCGGN